MLSQSGLRSQEKLKNSNYWLEQITKIPPLIDFPTLGCPRKLVNSKLEKAATQQHTFSLWEQETQIIQEFAQQVDCSISLILLATYQVLLYRYSLQEEIIVSSISDRAKSILPLKVNIDEQTTFTELLTQLKIQVTQKELSLRLDSLASDLSTTPSVAKALLQMLFRFNINNSTTTTNVDLTKIPETELLFEIEQQPSALVCCIEYNSTLFEQETIKRLAKNYQVLLQSILANPQKAIASLSLVSSEEKQQVLYEWNQTQRETVALGIHQLFENQVQSNPDAVAIICQGEKLTYGELNTQANQLARYLQSIGVKPQSLVGLSLERSPLMVVSVLAILKVGAAYVPLDVTNPPARVAFILEDAAIEVLLTQSSLQDKLPTQVKQMVCLDRDWHLISQQDRTNLNLAIDISSLAHVVYTSGSTGKPKGVMITHGNLSHYAQALQMAFQITPADTYLHRGSIALIVSARQLLMPLAQGATVLVVTAQESRDPLELFALIQRHSVTIVDHVPSFWRNFWGILQHQGDRYRHLLDNQVRLVAAGGEQVTPEIYQCWRATFKPEVQLANIYGQTEGTGVVTVYPIPQEVDFQLKSLPVGYPVPNMRVYLLDKDLQPVPIGVAAEIHISGAGVAKGYLNRPQLTAEKFVPNPYLPGEKLYKTGDLGRYLADGSIQFIGRADRQVNIQGLRIELGEIEAVLAQHELVQEAAIVVKENKLAKTLSAYVVPGKKQPTTEMLHHYLQANLPSYMVPKNLIFLDSFPLTTSGKVDRRALSSLNLDQIATPTTKARDRYEAEIVTMLEEILGITNIGVRDNFIELGGNSLLAARLVTEIENKYQKTISLSEVFQAPTPEALANLIRQETPITYPKSFVPIKLGNKQPSVFCIHYLGYGLEYYRPMLPYLHQDISLYGLSAELTNDPDAPHPRDILGLADYYVRDLLQFQPQGPYYFLGVSFGGVVAYEMAQILVKQGHEVKFLGLLDSHCPQGNQTYRKPSFQERLVYHFQNLQKRGLAHVVDKIQWRIQKNKYKLQAYLYSFDWIKNRVDQTTSEFSTIRYYQLNKEHQQVNQNYVMQPYPGKITLFRAIKDSDPKLEWQQYAIAGTDIIDLPGDHLEILQEPYVALLTAKIQSALLK